MWQVRPLAGAPVGIIADYPAIVETPGFECFKEGECSKNYSIRL